MGSPTSRVSRVNLDNEFSVRTFLNNTLHDEALLVDTDTIKSLFTEVSGLALRENRKNTQVAAEILRSKLKEGDRREIRKYLEMMKQKMKLSLEEIVNEVV